MEKILILLWNIYLEILKKIILTCRWDGHGKAQQFNCFLEQIWNQSWICMYAGILTQGSLGRSLSVMTRVLDWRSAAWLISVLALNDLGEVTPWASASSLKRQSNHGKLTPVSWRYTRMTRIANIFESFPCARHCVENLTCILLFNPHTTSDTGTIFPHHLTVKETEA